MHSVAYKAFYGINPTDSDVSHTLYLGARTPRSVIAKALLLLEMLTPTDRNINPRRLTSESNEVNRSRMLCAMFMDLQIWYWQVGLVPASWSEDDFRVWVLGNMAMCSTMHSGMPCNFSLEYYTDRT
jgi:hypothetical protein